MTGGYVYRGRALPSAVGRYFFGDYCSGTIWSLRVDHGRATELREEPVKIGLLSSFGEDTRGELYAVSQGNGGVYRVLGGG